MSLNGLMDKEDVIHIYNAILVMTNNGMLPFAATWVGLEIIMLSEVSHRKKNII